MIRLSQLVFIIGFSFFSLKAHAADCFLIMEQDKVVMQEGQACESRHSPCSTFKIPISLMGYDSGLLIDQTHPEYPFKEGYDDFIPAWKKPQNPSTWIQNGVVWYSRIVTEKLGLSDFAAYVEKLNYGNKNISGDSGEKNGLTHSWLSSSLKISPKEQAFFLHKLITNTLPVSAKAQDMTRRILFVEELPNGWNFYGKTGMGYVQNGDSKLNRDRQIGWFVGWASKGERTIIFTRYAEDEGRHEELWSAGRRAKQYARGKILELLGESSMQKAKGS